MYVLRPSTWLICVERGFLDVNTRVSPFYCDRRTENPFSNKHEENILSWPFLYLTANVTSTRETPLIQSLSSFVREVSCNFTCVRRRSVSRDRSYKWNSVQPAFMTFSNLTLCADTPSFRSPFRRVTTRTGGCLRPGFISVSLPFICSFYFWFLSVRVFPGKCTRVLCMKINLGLLGMY